MFVCFRSKSCLVHAATRLVFFRSCFLTAFGLYVGIYGCAIILFDGGVEKDAPRKSSDLLICFFDYHSND